jgi:hypothetical protein
MPLIGRPSDQAYLVGEFFADTGAGTMTSADVTDDDG